MTMLPNSKITAVGVAGIVLSALVAYLEAIDAYDPTADTSVVVLVTTVLLTVTGWIRRNVRKAPSDVTVVVPVPRHSSDPT